MNHDLRNYLDALQQWGPHTQRLGNHPSPAGSVALGLADATLASDALSL